MGSVRPSQRWRLRSACMFLAFSGLPPRKKMAASTTRSHPARTQTRGPKPHAVSLISETWPPSYNSRDNVGWLRLPTPSQRDLACRRAMMAQDSRETVAASRPSGLEHHGSFRTVCESRAQVGLFANQSLAKAPPPPFHRHFLSNPCAVDKETRTPPRSSFFSGSREDGGHSGMGYGQMPTLRSLGFTGASWRAGLRPLVWGLISQGLIQAEGRCLGVNLDQRLLNVGGSAFGV